MKINEPNPIVRQWLKEHAGYRIPSRAEGYFENYSTSRTSCCWGTPLGGIKLDGGIKIAVCQPSAQHKGDPLMLYYDYIIQP